MNWKCTSEVYPNREGVYFCQVNSNIVNYYDTLEYFLSNEDDRMNSLDWKGVGFYGKDRNGNYINYDVVSWNRIEEPRICYEEEMEEDLELL